MADKVLKRLQKELKNDVIDLSAFRAGRKQAQEMQEEVKSLHDVADLPPAFAAYASIQQQLSIMVELMIGLNLLHRFADVIERSENLYTPEGPPMSPLTPSYYNCWLMFDVGVGMSRETLATIAIAVSQKCGAHEKFLHMARVMADSRMGLYQITAVNSDLIEMKELWTGSELTARSASGYNGRVGEVWFTRILPPNELEPEVHVIFGTPYNMYQTSAEGWEAYIERALRKLKSSDRERAFHQHMKFGSEPFYWPEYIFYSFVNYTEGYIWAKGFPDIEESLPISEKYEVSKVW